MICGCYKHSWQSSVGSLLFKGRWKRKSGFVTGCKTVRKYPFPLSLALGITAVERIELTSKVDENGILNLTLSLGDADANREVRVTVESLDELSSSMSTEQWQKFVQEMAGSISDPEFRRYSEGGFERRDELFP